MVGNNTKFDFIGDPRAVKGGLLREYMRELSRHLTHGRPEWNTQLDYMIVSIAYETLLSVHPTTLEFMPAVATHWQISPISWRSAIESSECTLVGWPTRHVGRRCG